MIPYEDLCAALESYRARTGGPAASMSAPATPMAMDDDLQGGHAAPHAYDPPTSEVQIPADVHPSLSSRGGGEEGTHIDGMPPPLDPVYDDRSNEIDVGDIIPPDDDK